MTEDNWAEARAEWDGYDIADLETGEASSLPEDPPEAQEHSQPAGMTLGGLIAWLRGLFR